MKGFSGDGSPYGGSIGGFLEEGIPIEKYLVYGFPITTCPVVKLRIDGFHMGEFPMGWFLVGGVLVGRLLICGIHIGGFLMGGFPYNGEQDGELLGSRLGVFHYLG